MFSSWIVDSLRRSLLSFHFPVSKMVVLTNSNLPSVFYDTRKGVQVYCMYHYAKPERNNEPNLKMDVVKNFLLS